MSSGKDYWVNAKELTENELSDGATRMLLAIDRAAWSGKEEARRACEFLFALSNTALPDVRGNYFWPSAFAEVVRRSRSRDHTPTKARFEKYFREAISEVFSKELERLGQHGIHNRYIAVVFKQAGIGKDRNQILRGYLEFLVDRFSLNSANDTHSEGAGSIAARALKEYLQAVPEALRKDVHYFSAVLVRLGSEVLVLANALENDPNRADAAEWSWVQLRNFWIQRTGIDLEELTPSASHVLLDLVGSLSKQWLRRDIFRLGKTGSITLRLPDGHDLSHFRNYRDIPVGPAELTVKGKRQLIRVTDRKELTSEYLSRSEPDVWHWQDDEYAFKISASPFVAGSPGTTAQPAAPYYVGDTLQGARRLGFFWGGTFEEGRFPESGPGPRRSFLNLRIGFGWRHDRLFLEIKGFSTSLPDNGSYTLAIGGREVWKGTIRFGKPERIRRHWVDVGRLSVDDSMLKVALTSDTDDSINTSVRIWPYTDKVFLVVGRKAYRSGSGIQLWQDGSGRFPEVRLVSSEPGQMLHLANLDPKESSSVPVSEHGFSITLLTIKSPGQASVRFGDAFWTMDCRPAAALRYAGQDVDAEINGILISGTGNISVVRALSQLRLRADYQRAFDDPLIGFWINTAGSELFCNIYNSDWLKEDSSSVLCLQRLMERNGLDLSFGAIGFVLGTQFSRSSRTFNFFIAPAEIGIEITRFGERSRLTFGFRDVETEIASNEEVTQLIFNERKLVSGCIKGPDWDVWFSWKPLIFDWTINGEIGIPSNYEYSLQSESFVRADRKLVGQLSAYEDDLPATIAISEGPATSISAAPTDLWQLLARHDGLLRLDKVGIVITQGSRHVAWTINLEPVLESVSCIVLSQIADHLELRAEVAIYGYRRGDLSICCVSEATNLEERAFLLPSSQMPALSSTTVDFAICLPRLDQSRLEILVLLDGKELGRSSVSYPESASNSGQPEPPIRELIDSYKRTGAPALLPAILRKLITAVADTPNMASSVGNIMTQIANHGEGNDEVWLNLGLNSLSLLRSAHPRYVRLPSELPKSENLGTTVCALWLLLAERYAAHGSLMPEHYIFAMNHVGAKLSSESAETNWTTKFTGLVYEFASRIPSRYALGGPYLAQLRPNIPLSPSASAEREILGAISSEYKNWQETV